ncbi:MAG: DUF4494 domain-containing protein [Crocinitomicaceae bacterium]|nr:DUF4494 domain-containing protein [Crocinitomicaceae bacterium]
MNSWFTVKVRYTKQLEDGRLKRVTEPYLVDAVSFTDAEARIYEEVGTSVQGEFVITGISKTDFADIFYYEDAEDWYKCKLTYISMDADSGKEKKVSNNFLVTAHNLKEAYERIQESMSEMLVSYEIPSIMLTPIVEVLPYNPDFDTAENQAAAPKAFSSEQDMDLANRDAEDEDAVTALEDDFDMDDEDITDSTIEQDYEKP